MANIKDPKSGQPGGNPIASRQGGAPEMPKETDLNEIGRPHQTRVEKEREKLIRDPNLNQAGNDRGSNDQTRGTQEGGDTE